MVHAVALDGTVEQLRHGPASGLAVHPGGAVALSTPMSRPPAHWKRYRGGTAPRLWLDRAGDGSWERLLPDIEAGLVSPNWIGDTLVFASDQGATFPDHADGQANLWALDALGSGEPTQVTHHGTAEGYVRDPAGDGERIVYHARGVLYLLTGLDASPDGARRHPRRSVGDASVAGAGADRTAQRACAPTTAATPAWSSGGARCSTSPTARVRPAPWSPTPACAPRLPRLLGRSGSAIVVTRRGRGRPPRDPRPHRRHGGTNRRRRRRPRRRARGEPGRRRGDRPVARRARAPRRRRLGADAGGCPLDRRRSGVGGVLARRALRRVGATDPPRAVAPDRRPRPVPRRRRAGDADLGPVRRHVPVVQPRRQAPAVPLGADLRSELRPALLRPVVRRRGPPLPRAAHRHRGGAVRTERRGLADQRPGRTAERTGPRPARRPKATARRRR